MVPPEMIPKLKILIAVMTALIILCLGLLVYGLAGGAERWRDTGTVQQAEPGVAKQVIEKRRERHEERMRRFKEGTPRTPQPQQP